MRIAKRQQVHAETRRRGGCRILCAAASLRASASPRLHLSSFILRPLGFTLAESLFALAIVSFTILSIIGMMPGGLTELRAAERRAAESRILQSLSNEFQSKRIADLDHVPPDVLYFDVAGAELSGKTQDAVFAARVQLVTKAKALLLPGEATANKDVRHLRVLITERINDPAALSLDEGKPSRRREFSVVITNMEPDSDDGMTP